MTYINQNHEQDDSYDGWSQDIVELTNNVLNKIQDLKYEIEKCNKGVLTNCYNKTQLKQYIKQLSIELNYCSNKL